MQRVLHVVRRSGHHNRGNAPRVNTSNVERPNDIVSTSDATYGLKSAEQVVLDTGGEQKQGTSAAMGGWASEAEPTTVMCRRMTRVPSNHDCAQVEALTRNPTRSFVDLLHEIDAMWGQFDTSAFVESTLPFYSEFDGFENVGTRPAVTEPITTTKLKRINQVVVQRYTNATSRPVFAVVCENPDAAACRGG